MTEDYISTYGRYANKLLSLQLELIQVLVRHRRGHQQTVESGTSTSTPGLRGLVGIVNAGAPEGDDRK